MKNPLVELGVVLVLAAAVVASGAWVVGAKHRARQLFIKLEELNREAGTTIVLVTHDAALAAHARRVIRLSDGAVVEDSGQDA